MVEDLLFRTGALPPVLTFGESGGHPFDLFQRDVVAFNLSGPMNVVRIGILHQLQVILRPENEGVQNGIQSSDLFQHAAVFQGEGQHRLERYFAAMSHRISEGFESAVVGHIVAFRRHNE